MALSGRDVVGIAQTGSGKTASVWFVSNTMQSYTPTINVKICCSLYCRP